MSQRRGKRSPEARAKRPNAAQLRALKREAESVRVESSHGARPDVTLKRESRHAERVGARASLGGGMLPEHVRQIESERGVLLERGESGLAAYRAGRRARESANDAFAGTFNHNRKAGES